MILQHNFVISLSIRPYTGNVKTSPGLRGVALSNGNSLVLSCVILNHTIQVI